MERSKYFAAYAAVKERFALKAKQRDMLDNSEHYEAIMQAAQRGEFGQAWELLKKAGIL